MQLWWRGNADSDSSGSVANNKVGSVKVCTAEEGKLQLEMRGNSCAAKQQRVLQRVALSTTTT